MSLKSKTIKYATYAAIGGLGLYLISEAAKSVSANAAQTVENAKQSVGNFLEMFNPLSDQNIFFKGFDKGYKQLTGSGQSLGADIYDWTHRKPIEGQGGAGGGGSVVIPYEDDFAEVSPDLSEWWIMYHDTPYPEAYLQPDQYYELRYESN